MSSQQTNQSGMFPARATYVKFFTISIFSLPLSLIPNVAISMTSGQFYKQFTLVIYDPIVVIWSVFKSGTTLES